MATAYISNIQKFCVHDGPGIRSVVFLMGCPLRCKWCQNPENFRGRPVVMFNESLCIGCGECVRHCPQNQKAPAIQAAMDRTACTGCGTCVEYCYMQAKTLCGEELDAQEVYARVMKDETFYRETGGGVTLSGGEATIYPAFCEELLAKLQKAKIHTAVETCGHCKPDILRRIAAHTDLFLYDMKAFSAQVHQEWTGVSNIQILSNLEMLFKMRSRVIVRIPLIPGVNDGAEFQKMMEYLARHKQGAEVHILPFHQAGSSKYQQVDVQYEMQQVAECPPDLAEQQAQIARTYGFAVNIGGWDCR